MDPITTYENLFLFFPEELLTIFNSHESNYKKYL